MQGVTSHVADYASLSRDERIEKAREFYHTTSACSSMSGSEMLYSEDDTYYVEGSYASTSDSAYYEVSNHTSKAACNASTARILVW